MMKPSGKGLTEERSGRRSTTFFATGVLTVFLALVATLPLSVVDFNGGTSAFVTASADALDETEYLDSANYVSAPDTPEAAEKTDGGVTISGRAYYDNVLPSEGSVKLAFELGGETSAADGIYAEIAFLREKTFFSTYTLTTDRACGLYVRFSENDGKLNYVVYWVDESAKEEENYPEALYVGHYLGAARGDYEGHHVVEVGASRTAGYSDGVDLYIDGIKFDSFQLLGAVSWSQITANGGATLSFNAPVSAVTLKKLVADDTGRPIFNADGELPSGGYVGEYLAFPKLTFDDSVDGSVPFTVTVTDPNLIEETFDGAGFTGFLPEYEGVYYFELFARDYSGNESEYRFLVNVRTGDGMPLLYFEEEPSYNGRVGEAYILPEACVSGADGAAASVYDPDGMEIAVEDGRFTPQKIGEYRIVYAATNGVGTNKIMIRVYVKYNTHGGDVYKMIFDEAYWMGSVSASDGRLSFDGGAYCVLPFDLTEGVRFTLDLSGVKEDTGWICVNLTSVAGYNCYDSAFNGAGIYMMFRRSGGNIYYNVSWKSTEGVVQGVAYDTPAGTGTTAVVAFERRSDSVLYSDNVNLYVNGTKNTNYELVYNLRFSACTDNETFTYISADQFGGCSAAITSIDINDGTPPELIFSGELPQGNVSPGTEILLPAVTAEDAHDGTVDCYAALYAPDGSLVTTSENGRFTASQEGIWYYIVSASDALGNETYKIYEIAVGDTRKETLLSPSASSGCNASLAGMSGFLFGTGGIVYAIAGRRKKR